ncbi:MAG: restriction endonuclease [Oscillospiraceae bacterium]|nr:restriction endonuclease [Oscillospiraceae bacterium]
MALWVCRAGRIGEYETKFIEDNAVYCTWHELDWDMLKFDDREQFKEEVRKTYPDKSEGGINNTTGQLWAFSHSMKTNDLIATPSKIKSVIHFGEITSDYKYNEANGIYSHARSVKWLKEIPRSSFDKDLLFSFGGATTIFSITRKKPYAEELVRKMLGISVLPTSKTSEEFPVDIDDLPEDVDIEETALQEISDRLIAKFKGHGLAKVIAAILEAKGYTTFVSPPGPDNGVDILASQGSLGFDPPRICVQVKSGDSPLERTTLDQLIGAMSNHKADYGMLVSWGGFKSTIQKEEASQFFKVRLWTHREIVREFLHHYENLPEDIREVIPLKRIWIIDKREL